MTISEKIQNSAAYLKQQLPEIPDTAVVLGSGLGGFADGLTEAVRIPYGEIPNFPVSTVPGHKGMLVYGKQGGKSVLAMQGRFHYYEGNSLQTVAFPIQVFAMLGIRRVILTCAVGAINENLRPGDLVLIKDHIKFFIDNPLRGENIDAIGDRFFDLSSCYSPSLRDLARQCGDSLEIDLKEGVYAYMGGPNFETPAEIRMLRILGGDVVGMSTVPEAIAAAHAKLEVLGIACCSNMAAGILDQPLSHQEVLETSARIADTFQGLLKEILHRL